MVVKTKTPGPKHKHTKGYVKIYWPYMPLVIIVSFGLFIGLRTDNFNPTGVLPYSTNVSALGLLESTNKQRTNNQQKTLNLNDNLNKAAQAKADDMATRNYWSHNTPDGNAPWIFVTSSDYNYEKVGENLAYGFATNSDVISGWMNSSGHKANLLDPAYEDVGFGFANSQQFQNSGESTIVVAMYGEPQSSASTNSSSNESSVSAESSAYNNKTLASSDVQPQKISRIETITNGNTPWIQLAVGVLIGILSTLLVIKYGIHIKRVLKDGEAFVIHHPIFDISIIGLVILLIILSQQVGTIL